MDLRERIDRLPDVCNAYVNEAGDYARFDLVLPEMEVAIQIHFGERDMLAFANDKCVCMGSLDNDFYQACREEDYLMATIYVIMMVRYYVEKGETDFEEYEEDYFEDDEEDLEEEEGD